MTVHHSVVWLDHKEARVFHFDADAVVETAIRAEKPASHVHNKFAASGRREEHEPYYEAVSVALGDSPEILVCGPSTAKLELIRHVHRKHPQLEKRFVGVETVDHPTDGQLVAYAKKYFRAADRMR